MSRSLRHNVTSAHSLLLAVRVITTCGVLWPQSPAALTRRHEVDATRPADAVEVDVAVLCPRERVATGRSPSKLMSFQARATIAPTLRQSQAGERSTQPVRAAPDIQPVSDHRPTEPTGATTPGPSQSADGLQVVSRVKATRVPGQPPADEPAGASTSATASAERRTSGTPASAPARAGAEDLVSFRPSFLWISAMVRWVSSATCSHHGLPMSTLSGDTISTGGKGWTQSCWSSGL